MLAVECEQIRDEIIELADKYKHDRSALIQILQAIQDKYNYISDRAMQEIAYTLGIYPVEVYGVVTFYGFLYHKSQGHYIIRLCQTISCDMQGKSRIARQLENDLGIKFGETTKDGMFTLEYTNCLGMCDQGPALMVNNKVYTGITAEKVFEIIEGCRKSYVPPEPGEMGGHKQ